MALAGVTDQIAYPGGRRRGRPAAGQVLVVTRGRPRADFGIGARQDRAAHSGAAELGPYRHYMQKEIFEQPRAIANTLEMVIEQFVMSAGLFGAEAAEIFARIDRQC
jgi:glucosamine--fructose-6-phosphate aminotransferase (isomerizing)